jgi:RNA methyltransferase, TrmH family
MQRALERLRAVSSRQNPLLKELRRAFARGESTDDGHIAAEGVHVVEEAIRSGLRVKAVFFSHAAQGLAERLLPQLGANVEALLVANGVFASAVSTENSQGVAALVKARQHSLQQALQTPAALAVVCAGLQDPGNLGTIIRSAEAFGATCVLISEGAVSPFNAKVVRAAAGSLFRLPVIKIKLAAAVEQLGAAGAKLVATSSHGGKPLAEADFRGKVAVFVGSEGAGLARDLLRQMDEIVTIPHSAKVESLNAAMAASVVLYEAARQRGFETAETRRR